MARRTRVAQHEMLDKRSKKASSPAFSRMGEILFVFLR
jgi:hypothetical protein